MLTFTFNVHIEHILGACGKLLGNLFRHPIEYRNQKYMYDYSKDTISYNELMHYEPDPLFDLF
jgi:hypothetical protein